MKIDEKINNQNIKLLKKYGIRNSEEEIYTCVCCGEKVNINNSCSIGGAYLVCFGCVYEKFGGWYETREWQEKMFDGVARK